MLYRIVQWIAWRLWKCNQHNKLYSRWPVWDGKSWIAWNGLRWIEVDAPPMVFDVSSGYRKI